MAAARQCPFWRPQRHAENHRPSAAPGYHLFLDANKNRMTDSFVRHDVWDPSHLAAAPMFVSWMTSATGGFCNICWRWACLGQAVQDIKVGDFTAP